MTTTKKTGPKKPDEPPVKVSWRVPKKVMDNIEAIQALTGDGTIMGVITHAVAAYLYGLTEHIHDVEIYTEDSLKETAIINSIPAPVSDAEYWKQMAEANK